MHVETSAPVGSRALATRYGLAISAATVRNVMADLEARDLIAPPHTSAGRVPTDSGYRCYVDDLMSAPELTPSDQARIRVSVAPTGLLEDRLTAVAAALAELAPYTAIVQFPADESLRIRDVHLAHLSGEQVVVILVTMAGVMRHRVVEVPGPPDAAMLNRMARYMTEHLADTPLGEADLTLGVVHPLDGDEQELQAQCRTVARQLVEPSGDARVLLDGTRQLMEQPEFQDHTQARDLMQLLEAKAALSRWLAEDVVLSDVPGTVQFRIGLENTVEEAHGCTLAMVPYRIGSATGRLALVGPRRMRYQRAAALLTFTGRHLTAACDV